MKILDRLPISGEHLLLELRGEPLRLKPYQIIIHVSISSLRTWDARTPIIPALLDTGLNHNFSIQEPHVSRWAGVLPQAFSVLGSMREGARILSRRRAHIWIHRNQSGKRNLRGGEPFLLSLEEGIAIYPDDGSNYPRLPLLGLRAIVKNNLRLAVGGKRRHVSLSSPTW
jgi:hypothetical protein